MPASYRSNGFDRDRCAATTGTDAERHMPASYRSHQQRRWRSSTAAPFVRPSPSRAVRTVQVPVGSLYRHVRSLHRRRWIALAGASHVSRTPRHPVLLTGVHRSDARALRASAGADHRATPTPTSNANVRLTVPPRRCSLNGRARCERCTFDGTARQPQRRPPPPPAGLVRPPAEEAVVPTRRPTPRAAWVAPLVRRTRNVTVVWLPLCEIGAGPPRN
ncbi:hypothetical protein SAMN05216466_10674 [Paraburkholderia phenazinium]|uniref:Uncharacterized protein n=1 Tax=Paraburkholderia phenazinium TaxID=60549 RepID=A0A1G7Y7U5_9BURK|nr:hypothetical protein SAMN05216466_10674 [Paraburkholderia phenazinium]